MVDIGQYLIERSTYKNDLDIVETMVYQGYNLITTRPGDYEQWSIGIDILGLIESGVNDVQLENFILQYLAIFNNFPTSVVVVKKDMNRLFITLNYSAVSITMEVA